MSFVVESEPTMNGASSSTHLRRFDDSALLLQRARHLSLALWRLQERLRPADASIDALHWRLHGPIGPLAIADGLVRAALEDETLPGEAHFLLAELALTVAAVDWVGFARASPASRYGPMSPRCSPASTSGGGRCVRRPTRGSTRTSTTRSRPHDDELDAQSEGQPSQRARIGRGRRPPATDRRRDPSALRRPAGPSPRRRGWHGQDLRRPRRGGLSARGHSPQASRGRDGPARRRGQVADRVGGVRGAVPARQSWSASVSAAVRRGSEFLKLLDDPSATRRT